MGTTVDFLNWRKSILEVIQANQEQNGELSDRNDDDLEQLQASFLLHRNRLMMKVPRAAFGKQTSDEFYFKLVTDLLIDGDVIRDLKVAPHSLVTEDVMMKRFIALSDTWRGDIKIMDLKQPKKVGVLTIRFKAV